MNAGNASPQTRRTALVAMAGIFPLAAAAIPQSPANAAAGTPPADQFAFAYVAGTSDEDFTAALQARVDAAAANGGGIVEITHGSAKLTRTIRLKRGVKVCGRSKGGTQLRMDAKGP